MTSDTRAALRRLAALYRAQLVSYERSLRVAPSERARSLDEWARSAKAAIVQTLRDLSALPGEAETLADLLAAAPAWLEDRLDNETWLGFLDAALVGAATHGHSPRSFALSVARACALSRRGDTADAEALLRTLLSEPPTPDTDRARLSAYNALGQIESRRARYPESLACHEQARALAEALGDGWLALEARMNVAVALDEMREVDRAAAEYEAVLEQATSDEFIDLRMNALQNLATLQRLRGNFEDAKQKHESQLVLARTFKLPQHEALALNGLGLIHASLSEFLEAENTLRLAMRRREMSGDLHGASVTRASLAIVLDKLGRDAESEAMLERELADALHEGDPRRIAMLRNNLFNRLFNRQQWQRARELSEQNLAWARESGDPVALGMTSFAMQRMLRHDERHAEADALLVDAVAHYRLAQHHDGLFTSLFRLGQSALERGDGNLAYDSFFECLELADAAGHLPKVVDCLLKVALCERIWVSIEAASKRLNEAAEYCNGIEDQGRRAEVERQIADLRADFAADLADGRDR